MCLTIGYFLTILVLHLTLLPVRLVERPQAGLFFVEYPILTAEPSIKRTIAFIDSQNLFYSVKEAFRYTYPNNEPISLVTQVCAGSGWQPTQIRFYTGIPDNSDNSFWNHSWTAKLEVMGKKGSCVFRIQNMSQEQT